MKLMMGYEVRNFPKFAQIYNQSGIQRDFSVVGGRGWCHLKVLKPQSMFTDKKYRKFMVLNCIFDLVFFGKILIACFNWVISRKVAIWLRTRKNDFSFQNYDFCFVKYRYFFIINLKEKTRVIKVFQEIEVIQPLHETLNLIEKLMKL